MVKFEIKIELTNPITHAVRLEILTRFVMLVLGPYYRRTRCDAGIVCKPSKHEGRTYKRQSVVLNVVKKGINIHGDQTFAKGKLTFGVKSRLV